MPALKEFANFITLNMANLAETYAQLLAESGVGYEAFSVERRVGSARRLLKAVIETFESETSDPLCRLFDGRVEEVPHRWPQDIFPPDPALEVECLGQTLVPVVTNLEASKFLWQVLAETRAAISLAMETAPSPEKLSPSEMEPSPQTIPLQVDQEETGSPLQGQSGPEVAHKQISEYQQAQAVLDEERNLLRSLIDNVPDRIYAKDTQSRFIVCNVATVRRMGKTSPDEIVGKSDFDLVPPELAERFYADEQAVIQSGKPVINREEPLEIDEDGRVIRWNLATKVPLRDNQGNIIGVVGLGREITELKRTEEALARAQNLLQTMLDNVPDRIYFKDTDSRFLRISKSQAQMFGLSDPEQAVGKTDFDFFTEEHARPAFEDEQRIIKTGQPVVDLEEKETWPDGHETWVLTTKMPLHNQDGHIIGTFGISRDITERKLSEQIMAKRAAQLETVAQVSTATSTILDTQELLQTVVDLTKERFNLYHAHIYLLNQTGDTLDLAAGAGQVGRQMVAQGWHIPLAQVQSLAARAARTRQGVVVNNVREDPDWLANPLLPDTCSELAIPLLVGDRMLGVLDVQADKIGSFTDEDVRIQTTLAAQIAIAIHNAALFESVAQAQREAEERLQETQTLQQLTQKLAGALQVEEVIGAFFEACTRFLGADYALFSLVDQAQQRVRAIAGFNVTEDHIRRANHPLDSNDIMADIIRTGQTDMITGWDPRFDPENFTAEGSVDWGLRIFTPISLRQENIGLVEVGYKEKIDAEVQDNQVNLLRTLVDQTAIALESAQRHEASQKAARREQIIRQITEKMRAAASLEELVKTAAMELGEQLSAGHAVVELGTEL
ncbi:MAG: PAS domain-containing protein [Anaerolineae bacterium]|nr:PAS domain-containing protein [Anaerolineae bacterium]